MGHIRDLVPYTLPHNTQYMRPSPLSLMTAPLTINRIAVTLIPAEACLAWINSGDDDKLTLDEIQEDPTT